MSTAAKPAEVSRTAAGDHEIAVPSLGLSLTQRRLLTLLDRPIPAESLAERSGLPPEKFIRDLGRLAKFQLVEGALPDDVVRTASGGVQGGAAGGDSVTRTAVSMPAAVTIRPAANAASMAPADDRPAPPRRWIAPAVVVAIAGIVAIGYAWWPTGGGSRTAGTAITPPAPGAADAASPAHSASHPPAAAASPPATTREARTATVPAPSAAAASAAAVAALRRSEAQSLAREPAARARGTSALSKDHPARAPAETPAAQASSSETSPSAGSGASVESAAGAERAPGGANAVTGAGPTTTRVAAAHLPADASNAEAPIRREPPPAIAAAPAAASVTAPAAASVTAPAATPANSPVNAPAASPLTGDAAHELARSPRQVASVSRTPSEPPAVLAPIARVAPEFPAEAIRRRIDSGRVHARVTVDANGHVTAVAIVGASPRNVFDDAVKAALAKWRFPPGAAGRKADVDIEFRRD
ncbi:MAG: TonB family protein [Proteobacteria bacterium]|jgi:TonB family protein|nr:TonB family protein [Pseudomonadota bacterium]